MDDFIEPLNIVENLTINDSQLTDSIQTNESSAVNVVDSKENELISFPTTPGPPLSPSMIKIDEMFSDLVENEKISLPDCQSELNKKDEYNEGAPLNPVYTHTRFLNTSVENKEEDATKSEPFALLEQNIVEQTSKSSTISEIKENVRELSDTATQPLISQGDDATTPENQQNTIEPSENDHEQSMCANEQENTQDIGLLFSLLGDGANITNGNSDDEYPHLEVVYKTRPRSVNVILAERALQSGRV